MIRKSNRQRVVLIAHTEASKENELLLRWLATFSEIVGVLLIREVSAQMHWKRLRNEYRRTGLLGTLDVLAFRLFYRLTLATRDRGLIRKVLDERLLAYRALSFDPPVITVENVNSPEAQQFLHTVQPDFAVARSKQILRQSTFGIPTKGVFVFHPGQCPNYRNSHGCFWALAENDPAKVALTVLRIDSGIDTGPVYGFFSYPFDPLTESHVVIQLRVLTENLGGIASLLLGILNGCIVPIDTTGASSAIWGQPRLSRYLKYRSHFKHLRYVGVQR